MSSSLLWFEVIPKEILYTIARYMTSEDVKTLAKMSEYLDEVLYDEYFIDYICPYISVIQKDNKVITKNYFLDKLHGKYNEVSTLTNQIITEGYYVNNKRDGFWKFRYIDTETSSVILEQKLFFEYGVLEGRNMIKTPSHLIINYYKNNKLEGKFRKYVTIHNDNTPMIELEGEYSNDLPNGIWRLYDIDLDLLEQTVISEGPFINGKRSGRWFYRVNIFTVLDQHVLCIRSVHGNYENDSMVGDWVWSIEIMEQLENDYYTEIHPALETLKLIYANRPSLIFKPFSYQLIKNMLLV